MKQITFTVFGFRVDVDFGWFSGESWKLFEIKIGEWILDCLFLFEVTFLKASLSISVERA